jgi:hypothetical protein
MATVVKRAYKYRFYPSPRQAAELGRTFGCVRKVWNLALATRTEAWYERQQRVSYVQSSAMLTQWKRCDDLAFLNEVSSVPLQRHQSRRAGGACLWSWPKTPTGAFPGGQPAMKQETRRVTAGLLALSPGRMSTAAQFLAAIPRRLDGFQEGGPDPVPLQFPDGRDRGAAR